MSVRRIAMLSVHTSPLAQPGTGDCGGMNVYVRSLASALARAGVECDLLTRREDPRQRPVLDLEPGVRVVHLRAGPEIPVPKRELPALVDPLVDAARAHLIEDPGFDALHANYWISGAVGHRLKHELDLPLVTTFHTLGLTKVTIGVDDDAAERVQVEREVVACSDQLTASTADERAELVGHYDAEPGRVEVIPPGVDHGAFFPADATAARRRLHLPVDGPVLLFVGRIQPLKGADLALECVAELGEPVTLVVVGGPSGAEGPAELDRLHELACTLGISERVRWVRPQPHEALADWYRAADVCLVPSRSESFGLVALEAAACGTPVVAANVGGLRSLVADGETGFLVDVRTPSAFAAPVAELLADPARAAAIGAEAATRSARYTWSITAARLRRVYADLGARELVSCA
ncbi:MAG TPA: glycosyltransferase [Acidimicrobiia bacterium]|jgi:D-inositol-3-phosphate glycosyltransferase